MSPQKRLIVGKEGQGLTEYTLLVLLVALVFWIGVRNTNFGAHLATGWSTIVACATAPLTCSA